MTQHQTFIKKYTPLPPPEPLFGLELPKVKTPGPKLTDDQYVARELLNGPARNVCLVGGSRSGKTSLIIRNLIIRALKAPKSRHLVARYRVNALRASLWLDTFPKVMGMWFPGHTSESFRQDGYEQLENGSQIWFGGLDEKERVEKILGQEYATIFANECSQIPYSSILVLRTRLAQPGTGLKLKAYYDLNPTNTRHWTNIEFGEKRDPTSRKSLPDPENYVRAFLNPEGNKENLDPEYLESLRTMPNSFRQRFYEGQYVVDVDGALWSIDTIELVREDPIDPDPKGKKLADFRRIVVAVDPSGAKAKEDAKSDEIGIIVAGKRHGNTATILEDATLRDAPKGWATRAIAMYKKWHADAIVAEVNYGGAMVAATIKAVDPNIPVKMVTASRGKALRAEPIAALYDEKKVTHAGQFPELEEQMCLINYSGYQGTRSPDRLDSLVWALTDLMLEKQSTYTLANVMN